MFVSNFFPKHCVFDKSEETPLINHRKMYLQAFSAARQSFHLTEKLKLFFPLLSSSVPFPRANKAGGRHFPVRADSCSCCLTPRADWMDPPDMSKSNPTICLIPVLQEHFQGRLGMQWQIQPVLICSKSCHWDLPEEFSFQLSSFPNSPSTSRVGSQTLFGSSAVNSLICSVSILQYAGSAGRIDVCRNLFFN